MLQKYLSATSRYNKPSYGFCYTIGGLFVIVRLSDTPVGKLQQPDVQHGEYRKIKRHYPDADSLLYQPEHHRHKCAADVGGGHLQTDDRSTVLLAEVFGSHVLYRGINGSHSDARYNKSRCRGDKAFKGQEYKQYADGFNGDARAYQQPVSESV